MAFIVVVLVFLASILLVWYAFSRRKYSFDYWHKRNIPCLEPTIPYGNLKGVGEKFHVAYVLQNIYNTFKGSGAKYCGAYFYSRPIAIILDLDLAKDILVKDFNMFMDRGLYYNKRDDPLSANLAMLDGHEWKQLRSKLTPAFSSGKMKFMFPTILKMANRLCSVSKEIVRNDGDIVEIKSIMMRYTADVIGTCAFGIECNCLVDPNAEFIAMGRIFAEKQRHSAQFSALITSYRNIARMLRIKSLRDDVANFYTRIVRETIDYRDKNSIRRNDFMDILLGMRNQATSESGGAITFNEIAANTSVFFTAGFDTSSITLTNCLFELAHNPDIQTKARNVIKNAHERHNGEFTYEMLMDMPYIYQIIQGKYYKLHFHSN